MEKIPRRNKFNTNQFNNVNFPHGKRINQVINYENNLNNAFIQNEDHMSNQPYQPYPVTNMYQIPMPIPISQTKEQNIKNKFKMYLHGAKRNNYLPYTQNDYMNFGENEMSLEDNPQIGNKKYNNQNWNKSRIQRKRKNNFVEMTSNTNNRAISTENNLNYEEEIPEIYYNDNYKIVKGGRKKATTVEYNNRNKNKKGFYKHTKLRINEDINNINNTNNTNNSDFSNSNFKNNYINNNNIKIYNNKSNDVSDIENENDSNLENDVNNNNNNNNYSIEEEYEEDDKNSQDIIILDDDKSTISKEVIDIKKIKLIEKPDDAINNKSSFLDNNKNKTKNKIIPELDQMCSEKEINEREKEKDLDRFEIDASAFPIKKADKS